MSQPTCDDPLRTHENTVMCVYVCASLTGENCEALSFKIQSQTHNIIVSWCVSHPDFQRPGMICNPQSRRQPANGVSYSLPPLANKTQRRAREGITLSYG